MKHIHTLPPILLIGLLLTLSSLPTVQAATNCAAVTKIPPAQCNTLLALYNSTDGANWTNKTGWNETDAPCSWYGITCGGGNVTGIKLYANNLKGSLPSLGALTGLQYLGFGHNQLTETIPDLSKLASLQYLDLQDTQLTGAIPNLSQLTSLQYLNLSNNQLTGTVPDLSQLTNLLDLALGGNQLTGTIPDLSQLTNLRYLSLGRNQLTGTILDLSNLTNLQTIFLNDNQLTGAIPDLSELTSLRSLFLGNNPQLCKDPNANYGTRTEVNSFPICGSTISLTIIKTGTGTGEVKTADAKINCGTTCTSGFLATSTVTLTATPATDSTFAGWSGDCTGTTANATLIMNAAKSCTATFSQIPQLTVSKNGTGTGEVKTVDTKINCGTTCQNSFSMNSTVTLTATPSTESTFAGWSGNCTGTTANATVTMGTAKSCTATFNKMLSLTISKSGVGTGVVKTADTKLNCGTTCQNSFAMSSTVTLTATPSTDSTFASWSGNCTGTTANVAVTMDTAKSCIATFDKIQLSLTVTKTGTGTGEVKTTDATINCGTTCKSSFPMSSTVTLTATPATYSTFTGWSGNCTGTTANVAVTMNAAKTCTANFNLLPFSCNNVTEIPPAQCDTLVALYNSTDGANWTDKTSWTQTNTPCSWKGITCNGDNVTNIILASNNLKGSLPTLSALTGLQILDLSWNQLTGTLPNLSMLTNLQFLYLQYNQFTGNILDWSKLTKLRNLYLNDNQLTGTIPDWSMLTSLQALVLNNNQLTGTIPDVSKLTSLQRFYLNNNQLTGTLPNWSQLTNLRYIIFNNNQLTGSLPDLSKLTNLLYLGLSGNQLTGTLPDWSKLTNLQNLYLNDNQLTGTIPDWSMLTNLQNLYLNRNQLTGTIPDWSKLTNLRNLYLSNNQLTGTIPDWSKLTSLPNLVLNNNQLTGSIPEWNMLTNLLTLYLSANQLSGPIPNLNTLTKLTTLQLSSNPQLCRDANANYGTRTEVNSFPICGSTSTKSQSSLIVSKTGTGTGIVATADAKLNCGTTCQNDFSANTAVTLIAISSAGSTFTGWTGDCTGTDTSITLTLDVAKTCVANFATVPADTVENCPTTPVNTGVTLPNTGPDLGAVNSSETISSSVSLPEYPFCAQVTEIPKAQCQTLLAIYDNTAGTTWTHQDGWNTTTPCQWYGVECTIGQVTALRLANNNLQGTLPTLAALTSLKQLAVEDNLLKGTLSGLPTTLEIFTGDRNQLSGPLTVVQTLTQLRQLNLSDNQLSDALPDLSLLTRLEILNLNNNQLAGPIPDLRKLTQLKQLLLKDNHLAGAIPALTVADTLDLSGNDQLCRDINITYTQPALNAYPPCTYPTLTVAKIGSGIGMVSATSPTDQDKLNCGLECLQTDQTYSPDSNVTVTATPTEGTVFKGWSGECSGETKTITVTLDQAKTCVANFEIQEGYYELQMSKTGIGKGTVTTSNKNDPFHCDAKCQETRGTYPANTQVKLWASASKGSEFTGWGGACSGTDQRFTLTMDQAKSCYANFNLKEPPPPAMRQLIINTDAGTGKGTVTTDREDTEKQGIDCGIDCLENYQDGKYVKLTATPLPGSSFLSWEDDCSGKDPTLTVKMTDNKLCTAIFVNDIEMNAAETVSDFYTNGYLDTGEEVQDRYPRYPDNDQRLREAFLLAQPAILTVDLQVDLDNLEATWPIQFNDGMSFFRLQPAAMYTESVKILKDAIVQGYLSPAQVMGYYVEVRVKLLNYEEKEEWVPILIYYGESPTITTLTSPLVRSTQVIVIGSGRLRRCTPRC